MKKKSDYGEKLVKYALQIPKGKVVTYGMLNNLAGGTPRMAQMVTHMLSKSEQSANIPYWRIVYTDGRVFSTEEYDSVRMQKYKEENIEIDEKGKIKDFKDKLFRF